MGVAFSEWRVVDDDPSRGADLLLKVLKQLCDADIGDLMLNARPTSRACVEALLECVTQETGILVSGALSDARTGAAWERVSPRPSLVGLLRRDELARLSCKRSNRRGPADRPHYDVSAWAMLGSPIAEGWLRDLMVSHGFEGTKSFRYPDKVSTYGRAMDDEQVKGFDAALRERWWGTSTLCCLEIDAMNFHQGVDLSIRSAMRSPTEHELGYLDAARLPRHYGCGLVGWARGNVVPEKLQELLRLLLMDNGDDHAVSRPGVGLRDPGSGRWCHDWFNDVGLEAVRRKGLSVTINVSDECDGSFRKNVVKRFKELCVY